MLRFEFLYIFRQIPVPHTDVFDLPIVRPLFQIIENFMVTQAVPLTQHPLFNLPAVVAQRLVKFPQMSGKTVYVRVLVIEFQRIDNQVCRFFGSLDGTVVLFRCRFVADFVFKDFRTLIGADQAGNRTDFLLADSGHVFFAPHNRDALDFFGSISLTADIRRGRCGSCRRRTAFRTFFNLLSALSQTFFRQDADTQMV